MTEDLDGRRYQDAACGLLTTDADGLVVAANRTVATWLDREVDELVGKVHLTDLLTPAGRIFYETHFGPMLRLQGMVRELAFDLLDRGGNRLPVLLNARTDVARDDAEIQVSVMEVRERRSYETELLRARTQAEETASRASELARMLQQTLIPPPPPEIPTLDVVAAYQPASGEVGGDFYDVFPLRDGQWAVVLGDVCGKGVRAAVVSAVVRHTVRALMSLGQSPAQMAAGLHQILEREAEPSFCTMVALRLTSAGGSWDVELANCGHPPAVLLAKGGGFEELPHTGSIVGLLPEPRFNDVQFSMDVGDCLVLYTDGVTETRGADGFFGVERVVATLDEAARSPRAVVDALVGQVAEFQESDFLADDVAILAFGVSEFDPPAAPEAPVK